MTCITEEVIYILNSNGSREFFYRKDRLRPLLCPCVDITVAPEGKFELKSERFLVRLDTGADVSLIPKKYVKPFLPGRKYHYFNWTDANGRSRKQRCTWLWICIYDGDECFQTVFPPEGVLLTERDTGFLGMDVLQYFDVTFYGDIARFDMKSASPRFRFHAERVESGVISDD